MNIPTDYFGNLSSYIEDNEVTDILWNGKHLWIKHLKKGKYRVPMTLSNEWLSIFSIKLSHLVNRNFNYSMPVLEVETDDLRVSVIYPTFANQNYSLAIRKTPAIRRLENEKMIQEKYADSTILSLMEAMVKSDCSIMVIGEPGCGKTELIKYLTKFIPDYQRTATIEDKYELRLSKISPNLDVVELRVNEKNFTYRDAIKACLQQDIHTMILQEVRAIEANDLLVAASTGCRVMTTFHCEDVCKVADRMVSMIGEGGELKRNDVYSFFDIAIKIHMEYDDQHIHRFIEQIGILERENDVNKITILYDQQGLHLDRLSTKFKQKIKTYDDVLQGNKTNRRKLNEE